MKRNLGVKGFVFIKLNLVTLKLYVICDTDLDVVWMVYWILKIIIGTSLALLNKRDLVV